MDSPSLAPQAPIRPEIRSALDALNDIQRTLLDLVFYQRQTAVEAADATGLSVETVRAQLRSILLTVGAQLVPEPSGPLTSVAV